MDKQGLPITVSCRPSRTALTGMSSAASTRASCPRWTLTSPPQLLPAWGWSLAQTSRALPEVPTGPGAEAGNWQNQGGTLD